MPTESAMAMDAGGTAATTEDRNIFLAISNGKVNRLHSILANIEDLNVRDNSHRTPLIHAVFIPNDDIRTHIVRLLLRHGCDVNAQDGQGRSALMYACMERDKIDVVRLLAKCRRCDPSLQDQDGNTALIHSVEAGNTSAIRILLGHHGMKSRLKVNQVNGAGLSAIELSVKLGQSECCRLLMQEGGADTSRIKNRNLLKEIVNDYRNNNSSNPFDLAAGSKNKTASRSLGLNDADNFPFTPRPTDRSISDTEPYTRTTDSRNGRGPDTPRPDYPPIRPGSDFPIRPGSDFPIRPGSDFPTRPGSEPAAQRLGNCSSVLSLRKDISCELPQTARSDSCDLHRMSNPFLEMVRQDSSLYVPNSRTTFRRTIVSKNSGGGKPNPGALRRPLTPIATCTPDESRSVTPVIQLPMRLPSIPSGKRLQQHAAAMMLTPCDTPSETS